MSQGLGRALTLHTANKWVESWTLNVSGVFGWQTYWKVAIAQIWFGIPSWMEARVHCYQWSHSHTRIHLTVYSVNIQAQRFSFQIQQRSVCNSLSSHSSPRRPRSPGALGSGNRGQQFRLLLTSDNSWPVPLAVCPVLVWEAWLAQVSDVTAWHSLLCTDTYNRVSMYDLLTHRGHHGLEVTPHSHSDGVTTL